MNQPAVIALQPVKSSAHHLVLSTQNLKESQEFTTRVWTKHHSEVPDETAFASDISRLPLGNSHLCMVDCSSPIQVIIEPCSSRSIFYLPLEGSMRISAINKTFCATAGAPAFLPEKLAYEFTATPIKCMMFEIATERLRKELHAAGLTSGELLPAAWAGTDENARAITQLANFTIAELTLTDRPEPSPSHLRRLEAVMISSIARMLAQRLGETCSLVERIGRRTPHEIEAWISQRIGHGIDLVDLASFAGVTPRTLQRGFLRHFHRSPAAHIRDLSLQAAHSELQQPRCRETITEIATKFQFWHLGRFSALYRKKFGECPSETLLRGKR